MAAQWILLAVAVAAFAGQLLRDGVLTGNEAEVFEALDRVILRSWHVYGRFPLWNPYLRSGMPVIGDPMLHIADPLVGLPILLGGVDLGFRIATVLSFLAAAIGMWCLTTVLEVRAPVRIWMSLVYAFCGPAVARFYQGQYLFVFGFAWVPWVFAAFLRICRRRRWRDAGWAALSLAMLFLAGNVYYTFFMAPAVVLLFAAHGLARRRAFPWLTLDGQLAMLFATAALVSLLLVSFQLLPMFQMRPRLAKAVNPEMTDSQTLPAILRDLVSPEIDRADATAAGLTTEEYYAYVGLAPLGLLLLIPLAVRDRGRAAAAFFALLLYAIAWIDVAQMPWRSLYRSSPWIHQFRYPTRMLLYLVLSVLVLGGLGADAAWRRLRATVRAAARTSVRIAAAVGILLLSALLLASAVDVFRVNGRMVKLDPRRPGRREPLDWLRAHDPGEYYVASGDEYEGVIDLGLRDLWAWYHWDFDKPERDPDVHRDIEPRAEYLTRGIAEGPPAFPDPVFADAREVFHGKVFALYRFPHVLPYAFTGTRPAMEVREGLIRREEVTPVPARYRDADTVEVTAEAREPAWLVLLVAHYPGWSVTVDGRPALLRDADGYLAAMLRPGRHRYVFAFQPVSFRVGLGLTVVGVLALAGILWRGDRGAAAGPGGGISF